jgi:hypothetical protein
MTFAPKGGPEKYNRVATHTTYLWAGSWQVYLGSRKMVPNGSAWGQVSNVDKMAPMDDFGPQRWA